MPIKPVRNDETYRVPTQTYRTYYSNSLVVSVNGQPIAGPSLTKREAHYISSVSTPNYRSKNYKRKLLPNNPYSKRTINIFDPLTSTNQSNSEGAYRTDFVYTWNTAMFRRIIADESLTSEDPTQKAIGRLIEQISVVKADSATTMAEMGKTAQHLAHTATRLAKALIALRSGRFGDFAQALGMSHSVRDVQIYNKRFRKVVTSDGVKYTKKFKKMSKSRNESRVTDLVADTWLEYSYGWKPLLSDVYSHAEAAASMMVDKQGVVREVKASAKSNRVVDVPYGAISFSGVDRVTSERRVRLAIKYSIPDGQISPLVAFGLTNPLTVAWEIVPFSFVVDWFLPIGNYLQSLSAYQGLQFHSGYQTTKSTYFMTREINLSSYVVGATSVTAEGRLKANYTDFSINRVVLGSFPTVELPRFKDPRSFAHAASAIALLQSLFLRK